MQAFRWSDKNAGLAVWILTSGLTWVLECPLICLRRLEWRIGIGEKGVDRALERVISEVQMER